MTLLRKVRIHITLWFIIGIAIITGYFYDLFMMLIIIFIHEIGHILFAHFFSWRITNITILPFGGKVEIEEYGNKPIKEDFYVTIGGPIQHIWLWGLFYLLFITSVISEHTYYSFNQYNLMILLFNLLPIWPLDGGKLINILLSMKKPFANAHKATLWISLFSLAIFIALLLLITPYHLNGWIIIIYLLLSLIKDWRQQKFIFMRFLLSRYYDKERNKLKTVPIYVDDRTTILSALHQFKRDCKHVIQVTDKGSVKGTIHEQHLLNSFFQSNSLSIPIGDLLLKK